VKTANVVEVRTVRASPNLDPAYTKPQQRERAEKLLNAYPDISESETAEIVAFLAHGMHLDVGLVGARDEYREKIAAIRAAHPAAFRASPLSYLLFLLMLLVPLALLIVPQLLGRS
jgi:hypothetical protein